MAKVLTTGTVVQCTHQASIKFASTATLLVGGNPVVLESGMVAPTIACAAGSAKCATMVFATSATLRDSGEAIVLLSGLATDKGPCTITDDGHALFFAE